MRVIANQFVDTFKNMSMFIGELVLFLLCMASVSALLAFIWIVTNPCAGTGSLC